MSAEPRESSAPPRAPPRRRRRWLWIPLAVLGVLVLLVAGAILWVFHTPQGARFVLDRAVGAMGEGSRIEGVEGAIGGVLRIDVIEVSRPDLYIRVEDFEMEAPPMDALRGRLNVNRVAARSVEVKAADTGETASIPVSFKPPYPVRVAEARVGELRHGELTPEARQEADVAKRRAIIARTRDKDLVVRDILLRGAGGPREWKVEEARATTEYGTAGLAGTLGTTPPFALAATLEASGTAAERPYRANARLEGTLKLFDAAVDGEVSGQPARLHAKVAPFEKGPLRQVDLHAEGLDLARHGAGPRTQLTVDAQLTAQGAAFAGPVRLANAAAGPWDRERLPVSGLEARVVITPERVDIPDLALALAGGGTATGRATLEKSGVQAELRVADVDLAALHGALQETALSGRVAASGDRAAQRFEVALTEPRFAVQGRAGLARERLDVESVTVRTGGGAVTGKGTLALAGQREFRFEGRGEHFDPSAFVKTTAADLNFTFVASGTLAGSPAGEARIELAPSRYAGQPASGRIAVAGDRQRIAKADVRLTIGDAAVTARGSFGRPGDAMDVTLRAPNLSVLARPFGVAASGKLEAEARLTGTFESPAGRVRLTGANLALPSDVYVRQVSLRAEAGTAPDSPIDAALQARGVALGKDTPPTPFAEAIEATLKGTRREHRLETTATMTREATARLVLAGGLDPRAKEPAWNGRVEALSLTGRGAFTLAEPAPLFASAQRVELGDATLRGTWGAARLETTRWTPRTLELRGRSDGIEIQNVARSLRLGVVPRSNLVIAADWDIRAAEQFNGTLNMRRVSGDLRAGTPPLPMGLQELVVRAEVVQGRARATAVVSGERIGRLQGEGTGRLVRGTTGWELAAGAPVSARVVAEHSNLEVLAPWLGEDARLGGRLNALVTVSGTGADPRIGGEARVQDFTMREPQTGFYVERGRVAVRLAGKSLTIEEFTASTPWRVPDRAREKFAGMTIPAAGTITAEGGIDLAARRGTIRLRAEQVPLTQIATRFLAISGEARLEAGEKGLLATGQLEVDAGWIGALESAGPSVSEDVVVVRAKVPAAKPEPAAGERVRLDVRVSLGDRLYFQGRGLDTRLAGQLHVQGELGSGLRANGIIRTVGGTYNGYGQKLVIERGALQFSGPVDNPQLNVLAVRKGLAVEPGVEVLGTASRPKVRLVSTPDVPEPEKLSWLVLGRGPSELGPGDASVLLSAAASMLGGNNPGSDLGKRLGLDEVKIGRSDTNSVLGVLPQSTVAGRTGTASASEVVSVGRRITRNVHLTYEQGLADAEGALRIAWRISEHFQLLVRAGFLPGLDAVYRWSFP